MAVTVISVLYVNILNNLIHLELWKRKHERNVVPTGCQSIEGSCSMHVPLTYDPILVMFLDHDDPDLLICDCFVGTPQVNSVHKQTMLTQKAETFHLSSNRRCARRSDGTCDALLWREVLNVCLIRRASSDWHYVPICNLVCKNTLKYLVFCIIKKCLSWKYTRFFLYEKQAFPLLHSI